MGRPALLDSVGKRSFHEEMWGNMGGLEERLARRGVSVLTDEELRGNDIKAVKCRACSGYGACGYKTFYLYDGTPYSICNLRLQKIKNGEKTPEQLELEKK